MLSGGAGVPSVVTVDPRSVGMPELIALWESGLSPLPEEGDQGTVTTVTLKGQQQHQNLTGAFLKVFVEQAQSGCPDLTGLAPDMLKKEKAKLNYVKEILGSKDIEIKCNRQDTPSDAVVVVMPGKAHDLLFLGRDGRSRTLLWNLAPRVRIECSMMVLG